MDEWLEPLGLLALAFACLLCPVSCQRVVVGLPVFDREQSEQLWTDLPIDLFESFEGHFSGRQYKDFSVHTRHEGSIQWEK